MNQLQRNSSQQSKSIGHGDLIAHAFIWQKAFLLLPLWAVAVVPVIGFVGRGLGNTGLQLGFGLVLCLSALYFLEDLLKRKVRFDDEYIYFGFKAVPISSINSIDVTYRKGKFLPGLLIINYADDRRLKLRLSGLAESGVETLLKHLQARNSSLKTAAVLNTLMKCRSVKRKVFEHKERVDLPYNSRKIINESIDVFKSTAAKWGRIGPLIACILLGPSWVGWISWLYGILQPYQMNASTSSNLTKFLNEFFNSLQYYIYSHVSSTVTSVGSFAANPIVTFCTCASIAVVSLLICRILLRPNHLIADQSSLRFVLKTGELSLTLKEVPWAQIAMIDLDTSSNQLGKMRISLLNDEKVFVDLSAIAVEDRSVLLKRIEKLVPTNQIDHRLSQAMLPKADRSYTEIWLQSLTQSPERKALDPLDPGQLVGEERFEVLKNIGVGGQGKAYLCKSVFSESNEQIVLKETIMPIFADSNVRRKSLENFEKEASLLKSLDNDGVVKLLDYFVEDHRAYLVLEHIDGSNLRELVLRGGPLAEDQVRDLALQMCDILKVLHANGIVHRDFTPDNLILNSKGKLKLIDFNVAQQIQEGSSGTIVGKHAYLPPEQFRGKATSQSDLYALGATLFFLLTGTDPEPISQSSPRVKNDKVSESLDRIIKHATALQTNNRVQSAAALEGELLAAEAEGQTVKLDTKSEVSAHG